jgi:hypothetical protein
MVLLIRVDHLARVLRRGRVVLHRPPRAKEGGGALFSVFLSLSGAFKRARAWVRAQRRKRSRPPSLLALGLVAVVLLAFGKCVL